MRVLEVQSPWVLSLVCEVALRLTSLKGHILSIEPLRLIDMCFDEDRRANIRKTHVEERLDYETSNINNHSTLNSEHDWEDMCIQLKNQRT